MWQGARSCHQNRARGRRRTPISTRRTQEPPTQPLPATQPEAWYIGPRCIAPLSPSSSFPRRRSASALLLSFHSISYTILIYYIFLLFYHSDMLFYDHYIILLSCLYSYIMMFSITYVFYSNKLLLIFISYVLLLHDCIIQFLFFWLVYYSFILSFYYGIPQSLQFHIDMFILIYSVWLFDYSIIPLFDYSIILLFHYSVNLLSWGHTTNGTSLEYHWWYLS